MKIVIQRVEQAGVKNDKGDELTIQRGLVVLIGFDMADTSSIVKKYIQKVLQLRIFCDTDGKMNRSVIDTKGELLVIPNFTLSGSLTRGNRPSFDTAMRPAEAQVLFNEAVQFFRDSSLNVHAGFFGQHMRIHLCNDGPVTFILDSLSQ